MNTPVSVLVERKGSAVFSVPPTITIAEAVHEMNEHRVGCVLVMEGGKLVGIFTERDVLRRVVGADVNPKVVLVSEVMSRNVFTITPETTVEETMLLFAERRCRHIPVFLGEKLTGLISIGDISRWMAESSKAEAEHLKNYIAGGFPA